MSRLAAFLLMCTVWGLTWLPAKVASAHVPPIYLAALRFVLASLAFGAAALALGTPLRPPRPRRLLVASLLITTGCYAGVFWGVAHAPTGVSAIVNFGLMPIFIMVLGALHGEAPVTGPRLAAVALGLAGLALLFSGRIGGGADTMAAWGLAAVVAGTLCYGWGSVVSRPLMSELSPLALAFWQSGIGGLALLGVSFALEGFSAGQVRALASPPVFWSLAFLVGAGTLAGFTIFLWLVREWGTFRAGLYAFVSPPVAVAVGVLALGERFGWPEALGMAAMLGATAIVAAESRLSAS